MKLSAWMTKTKTTAITLAEKAGVSHTTIGRIARGEMEPRPDTRRRIVEATGGAVTELELLKLATSEAIGPAACKGDGEPKKTAA